MSPKKKTLSRKSATRRKLKLVEDLVFLLVSLCFLSRRKNRTIKRGLLVEILVEVNLLCSTKTHKIIPREILLSRVNSSKVKSSHFVPSREKSFGKSAYLFLK